MNNAQDEQLAKAPAAEAPAPKSHNARQSRPVAEAKGKMIPSGERPEQTKRRASDLPQEDDAPAKKRRPNTGNNAKASDKKSADSLLDVSDITLPGEEVGTVPVYETCDSIRRQIRAILKKPGMTQAAFCRALGRFGAVPDAKAPSPRQLARFLEKKGAMKGNLSVVFYPSYVLFEKTRIRDGKAKSKFRKEMEEKHESRGGVDINRSSDGAIHITSHPKGLPGPMGRSPHREKAVFSLKVEGIRGDDLTATRVLQFRMTWCRLYQQRTILKTPVIHIQTPYSPVQNAA